MLGMARGEFLYVLDSVLATLREPACWADVGLATEHDLCSPSLLQLGLDHPEVGQQNEQYRKCVDVALELCRQKLLHMSLNMFSWPLQLALLLGSEEEVATCINQLRSDYSAFTAAATSKSRWLKIARKRHPLQQPLMQLVLKHVQKNDWRADQQLICWATDQIP